MVPATGGSGQDTVQNRPKRRKLRFPRAARACTFCRRRKVRCSGTNPCEYCVREGETCKYDSNHRFLEVPEPDQALVRAGSNNRDIPPESSGLATDEALITKSVVEVYRTSDATISRASRRSSLEPPQTFLEGQHIGPTAGVSFLYHSWNPDPNANVEEDRSLAAPSLLTSYGDFSFQVKLRATDSPLRLPTTEKASALLERYFRFATPTYRFLHSPTLEDWTSKLLAGSRLSVAKSACVLLAFAQSLLYTMVGDRYGNGGDQDLRTSNLYFQKAKKMLDDEPGPATLASVQARLAMCLYLLSTFRINECRFCFSFSSEILTSLGLHRRSSASQKIDLVESESRKRTFWCAYVLDGYLSVMLGRPRLMRDEVMDQPYPRNLDDEDMLSSEEPEGLPLHGNLEAFIWHAGLAKLIGRNNDLLYPIHSLSEEDVLVRTNEMLEELDNWHNSLPDFLKSREKTLTGQRTFERQNTVLKLAHAHLRILATRRCLLADFSDLGRRASPQFTDSRALRPVQECVSGVCTIIGAAYDLMERGSLFQAFWFTQYTAMVAISTLYVFLIQGARNSLPALADTFCDVETFFDKARQCQRHLATIAPEGSQSRRHHKLLDHLKARVEKDLLKTNSSNSSRLPMKDATFGIHNTNLQQSFAMNSGAIPSGNPASKQGNQHVYGSTQFASALKDSGCGAIDEAQLNHFPDATVSDEQSFSMFEFTPESDLTFQNMLDWDWASLDTLGM